MPTKKKVRYYLEPTKSTLIREFDSQVHDVFDVEDLEYSSSVFNKILSNFSHEPFSLWNKFISNATGKYDSEIVALACVAISARGIAKIVRGSNPVWLKKSLGRDDDEKPSLHNVSHIFLDNMLNDLENVASSINTSLTHVEHSEFQRTTIQENSIDGIVTSPPYLNRLDYIVSHLPEILILSGFIPLDIDTLRRKMMGTIKTTLTGDCNLDLGATCFELLKKIRSHHTKASGTYYYKFFLQYFISLKETLEKIHFTCRNGAKGLLVLQDSYYKEFRIPLIEIFKEMGRMEEIEPTEIRTENVKGHMGAMSPSQKSYVPSKVLREHVLLLELST